MVDFFFLSEIRFEIREIGNCLLVTPPPSSLVASKDAWGLVDKWPWGFLLHFCICWIPCVPGSSWLMVVIPREKEIHLISHWLLTHCSSWRSVDNFDELLLSYRHCFERRGSLTGYISLSVSIRFLIAYKVGTFLSSLLLSFGDRIFGRPVHRYSSNKEGIMKEICCCYNLISPWRC